MGWLLLLQGYVDKLKQRNINALGFPLNNADVDVPKMFQAIRVRALSVHSACAQRARSVCAACSICGSFLNHLQAGGLRLGLARLQTLGGGARQAVTPAGTDKISGGPCLQSKEVSAIVLDTVILDFYAATECDLVVVGSEFQEVTNPVGRLSKPLPSFQGLASPTCCDGPCNICMDAHGSPSWGEL